MAALFENAGGRKFLLGLVSILAISAMAIYGKLDADAAVEAVKWIVVSVVGAIAVEDGLRSTLGKEGSDDGSTK